MERARSTQRPFGWNPNHKTALSCPRQAGGCGPVCQALQAQACCWTHTRAFSAVTGEVVAYLGRKNSSEFVVVTLSGLGLCGPAGQLCDVQSWLLFLRPLGPLP